jgi:hypothetical protein
VHVVPALQEESREIRSILAGNSDDQGLSRWGCARRSQRVVCCDLATSMIRCLGRLERLRVVAASTRSSISLCALREFNQSSRDRSDTVESIVRSCAVSGHLYYGPSDSQVFAHVDSRGPSVPPLPFCLGTPVQQRRTFSRSSPSPPLGPYRLDYSNSASMIRIPSARTSRIASDR